MNMSGHDETSALREVQERLAERFPHLGDSVVQEAVRLAHASMDGPIRDYVPVLVEHMARDRLAQMTAGSSSPAPHERVAV